MTATAPVLQVEDLQIKYHTREGILTAIDRATFQLRPGEILGVVGESGCGKSTVASAVMQLLPPNGRVTNGRIVLNGRDLIGLGEAELRRIRGREIGMVFQDPMTSLNPVFTIDDQMFAAMAAHQDVGGRLSRGELRQAAIEALQRVGIPDPERRLRDYPHQFSGGMRQRILIASALISKPAVLVADEPTSALDVTLEAQITDLIRRLRDELGTAILYITHDLGVVAQLCDRLLVMYAGSVVEAGRTAEVFADPGHPYTRALLRSHPAHGAETGRLRTIRGRVPSLRDLPAGCKFAPRCDVGTPLCRNLAPEYAVDGDRRVLCHYYHAPVVFETDASVPEETSLPPRPPAPEAGPRMPAEAAAIETRGLSTWFGGAAPFLARLRGQPAAPLRAVDGVDIAVRCGGALALVGESGSGKTTLGRTILRLEEPTRGEIIIEGRDITRLEENKLRPLRSRMQMIFQDPVSSLNPRMKVSDLLLEPFIIHHVQVDRDRKVEELLRMVGLSSEQADKYPHQLSGGQARRAGIARALALDPEILIADEPTAGLDVSVAAGILNLLKDLGERLGLTYILITHNLNVVNFIAEQVAVMYLGRVVELAGAAKLFAGPVHPYTQALISAVPVPDPGLRDVRSRIVLEGEIPSARNPPPGCHFHPRCRYAVDRCRVESPLLRVIDSDGHRAACHLAGELPYGAPGSAPAPD